MLEERWSSHCHFYGMAQGQKTHHVGLMRLNAL